MMSYLLVLNYWLLLSMINIIAAAHEQSSLRIVNGDTVPVGQFPSFVTIRRLQKSKLWRTHPFCGGTLLTVDTVLTAAHCFDEWSGESVNESVVYLGKSEASLSHYAWHKVHIREYIPHPEYSRKAPNDSLGHDIAILKLSTPVDFGRRKGACERACLPRPQDQPDVNSCMAIGMGRGSAEGHYPRRPLQVALTITDCPYPMNPPEPNLAVLICSYLPGQGRQGTCVGDSGGPLFCSLDGHPEVRLLYGIAQSGSTPECGRFSVFQRVSSYLDFILKVVEKDAT